MPEMGTVYVKVKPDMSELLDALKRIAEILEEYGLTPTAAGDA